MRFRWQHGRGIAAVVGAVVLLLAAFAYVSVRAGPMAPIPVTVATVETRTLAPAQHGIGAIEARFTHRVGPTAPGRVQRVHVDVGERVRAGQLLAELDPVDLDARLTAQRAAFQRARASVLTADAQLGEARARASLAATQARRYETLARADAVSAESFDAKRQDQLVSEAAVEAARAAVAAARSELDRARADVDGTERQRANLRLVAPVDGLVTDRRADPGSTVVAGQTVVEVVDPATLWVNARFDQLRAAGVAAGLPARIALRSRAGEQLAGRVVRVEPLADAVTEELLVKVAFDGVPEPIPSIGELAEVTVALAPSPAAPVVASASLQRIDGRVGVWTLDRGELEFRPVKTGSNDLDGRVQIVDGLAGGERVVVYSQRALARRSRVDVVERLPGVTR